MNNSAYSFPIFISSPVYNLIDLRAELNLYLTQLGYKVYMSDGDGFHDNTPIMPPWESCLNVLETAFIMILIIDGQYGTKFKWPNTERYIAGREVSPTHAEYLFANRTKKRTLVFVREEVLSIYQTYVTADRNAKKELHQDGSISVNPDEVRAFVKKALEKILPKHISFETLEFLHEVKNTDSIPWVKGFKDITDIKQEIQKKMLNELAEIFLIKTRHLETVFMAFAKIIDELPQEKRREKLKEFGIDKEYISEIEKANTAIENERKTVQDLNSQLAQKAQEFESVDKTNTKLVNELQSKIDALNNELGTARKKIQVNESISQNLFLSGTSGAAGHLGYSGTSGILHFTPVSSLPYSDYLQLKHTGVSDMLANYPNWRDALPANPQIKEIVSTPVSTYASIVRGAEDVVETRPEPETATAPLTPDSSETTGE